MAKYVVILIVVCSIFSLNAEAYGAYTLVKDVFSGEGAAQISASASYKLQGTLGQNPEPGIPRSTNYVIYEGFWNAEGMGVPPIFVKDISDKIIYLNEQCGSDVYYIPFEVTDDKTAVAELIVEKSSSNQQLIPDDNIEILDNKQIKIKLLNKTNKGKTIITLIAKDEDGSFGSESFNVIVDDPRVFFNLQRAVSVLNELQNNAADSVELKHVILILQILAGEQPTNLCIDLSK